MAPLTGINVADFGDYPLSDSPRDMDSADVHWLVTLLIQRSSVSASRSAALDDEIASPSQTESRSRTSLAVGWIAALVMGCLFCITIIIAIYVTKRYGLPGGASRKKRLHANRNLPFSSGARQFPNSQAIRRSRSLMSLPSFMGGSTGEVPALPSSRPPDDVTRISESPRSRSFLKEALRNIPIPPSDADDSGPSSPSLITKHHHSQQNINGKEGLDLGGFMGLGAEPFEHEGSGESTPGLDISENWPLSKGRSGVGLHIAKE